MIIIHNTEFIKTEFNEHYKCNDIKYVTKHNKYFRKQLFCRGVKDMSINSSDNVDIYYNASLVSKVSDDGRKTFLNIRKNRDDREDFDNAYFIESIPLKNRFKVIAIEQRDCEIANIIHSTNVHGNGIIIVGKLNCKSGALLIVTSDGVNVRKTVLTYAEHPSIVNVTGPTTQLASKIKTFRPIDELYEKTIFAEEVE